MDGFSIIGIILLVIIANIIWYWLKFDLKSKGYKIHYFYGHFSDLVNALDVINHTEEPKTKRTYSLILLSIVTLLILTPIIFFTNTGSFESRRCERFNDYLNYQVSGIIESKFIDKPNHALQTLILADGEEEREVTIFVSGLYEFLQPGDSIIKVSGLSELIVIRSGEETTFNVIRSRFCDE